LHNNEVDFVVHSLKDLPTVLPEKMVIGSILEREDPRDAVVMKKGAVYTKLAELPAGSIIGTSSLRRSAQLKANYPGLVFKDVRGNLNTRLRKLDNGEGEDYAALVLAVAGVSRMGWVERISEHLEKSQCMYAVGQGALGVECREDDTSTISLLSSLHHRETLLRAVAERAFLRKLEGGCSVPVAVNSTFTGSSIELIGGVWSLDGKTSLVQNCAVQLKDFGGYGEEPSRSYVAIIAPELPTHELAAAESCGQQLAQKLLDEGAEAILAAAKAENEKK
jgi:hydroxymethylbilane synthase